MNYPVFTRGVNKILHIYDDGFVNNEDTSHIHTRYEKKK